MTQIYIDLLYRFQRVKINTAFSFWTELIQEVPQGPLRGLIQEAAVQGCSQESCSENLQQIYRRTPMPKCDFNKVAKAWVFSCKFAAYFQNSFSQEHLWVAASVILFNIYLDDIFCMILIFATFLMNYYRKCL